jgi:hypothetical protein
MTMTRTSSGKSMYARVLEKRSRKSAIDLDRVFGMNEASMAYTHNLAQSKGSGCSKGLTTIAGVTMQCHGGLGSVRTDGRCA